MTTARLALLLGVLTATPVLLSACNTQTRWTYPFHPDRLFQSQEMHDLVIAVTPFEEKRPLENNSAGSWLALIPLVPYGTAVFNRPEAAAVSGYAYDFEMPDDLGRAAAESLARSRLVRKSFFTLGSDIEQADYVLKGQTSSTTYWVTTTFYGLSAPGDLLWLLGLPAGSNRLELSLTLSLEDIEGREHWSHTNSKSLQRLVFIYTAQNDRILGAMPSLMEDFMNDALVDLARALPGLEKAAHETRLQGGPGHG